jgi:hypothetical protein
VKVLEKPTSSLVIYKTRLEHRGYSLEGLGRGRLAWQSTAFLQEFYGIIVDY